MRITTLVLCLVSFASFAEGPVGRGPAIRLGRDAGTQLPISSSDYEGGLMYDTLFKQPVFNTGGEWLRIQPSIVAHDYGCVMPGSGTGLTNFGIVVSSVATVSNSGGVAGFGLPSTLHRVIATTSAAANQSAEFFSPQANLFLGSIAGTGGFTFRARWWNQATAPTRVFVGLASTAAALPAADPNALLNTVGVQCQSGDTNMSICSNDGAGTATCSTLGANFPCLSSLLAYDLTLYVAPGGSTVYWAINPLGSANILSGTLSSDVPVADTFLAPHVWANNSTSGAAVNLHLSRYCTARTF